MAEVTAYVALGSNLGDPALQVRCGIDALAGLHGTRLMRVSRLYRTPPWGRTDQPEFVNAVAALQTRLAPADLLGRLQEIERAAGRERVERWGPRVLDLDLLLHGSVEVQTAALTLPHPHIAQRAFVLVPLAEIAPDLHVPGAGRVADLLDALGSAGISAL